ncbi:hypothetical protein ABEU98_30390 [Priestia megaterium]
MSINKEFKSIFLTICLLVVAFTIFTLGRTFPNAIGRLDVTLWIYLFIDIGFVVSLILGIRTKKPSIMWFSIIANGILIILLSAFMFLLAIAYGISGP